MNYEYKTVDTSTFEGLKQAERLHISGWKIIRSGLFLIWFERPKKLAMLAVFMTARLVLSFPNSDLQLIESPTQTCPVDPVGMYQDVAKVPGDVLATYANNAILNAAEHGYRDVLLTFGNAPLEDIEVLADSLRDRGYRLNEQTQIMNPRVIKIEYLKG